ncbi:peptide deformylase, mitochondrial-like [Musca vetustissima]|uniref:peptide deformylase, mitochondrial-like n=1 Tax=Musca vetustissima TaxID=27455 RepID=UPI002AB66284|nr:peptide deformylase, mitochondrial-like [Musca vetustissima]
MALQKVNLLPVALINHSKRFFSTTTRRCKTFAQKYREFWSPKSGNQPPYGHFTQVGDPVLRSKAVDVPADAINSKEIDLIIDQMVKVLRKYDCVGIAAPQIGVSLRIIVMEFREGLKDKFKKEVYEARKMSPLPLTVMINPTLKVTNYTKHKHPEGCMSVRGYSAEVERYESVTLTGIGKRDTPNELQLNGWNARIAQHEMDHLDGKLYIDQMDGMTFHCTCWEAVNSKAGRVEIPFYK